MSVFDLLGLLEPLSIVAALLVLGLLSRRLGMSTHGKPRYVPFFIGAGLVSFSAGARLINIVFGIIPPDAIPDDILWTVLYTGLPALGITLGVVGAWRYWSWLLAERS